MIRRRKEQIISDFFLPEAAVLNFVSKRIHLAALYQFNHIQLIMEPATIIASYGILRGSGYHMPGHHWMLPHQTAGVVH